MALMVPIDEDLAVLLEDEASRSGESVAERANRVLRADLQPARLQRSAEPVESKPFKVRPFDISLPAAWTSGCVEELLDMAEGPERR